MKTPFQIQQERISKSIAFSAEDVFEKGGKSVPIGTIHVYSGTKYKKTIAGWIPIGKDKSESNAGKKEIDASRQKIVDFNMKHPSGKNANAGVKASRAKLMQDHKKLIDGPSSGSNKKALITELELNLKESIKQDYLGDQDHQDLKSILEHLKSGEDPKQIRHAVGVLDTIVRDVIPPKLHEIIGSGTAIKKSESNEELVSKHGDELLEKSEDGHFQVKTIDGTFKFNGYEMAEMYGGEWMEKGGEGSKGGKITGHTKSGKPIYGESDTASAHNDPRYSKYTHQDHQDAIHHNEKLHTDKAARRREVLSKLKNETLTPEQRKKLTSEKKDLNYNIHTHYDNITGHAQHKNYDSEKHTSKHPYMTYDYKEKELNRKRPEVKKSEDPTIEKAEGYLNAQEDLIEKGKALPIGTIKKRGPNNFQKTTNGWKYHSRAVKSSGERGELHQAEGKITFANNLGSGHLENFPSKLQGVVGKYLSHIAQSETGKRAVKALADSVNEKYSESIQVKFQGRVFDVYAQYGQWRVGSGGQGLSNGKVIKDVLPAFFEEVGKIGSADKKAPSKEPYTTPNTRPDEILAATKEINKLKEQRNKVGSKNDAKRNELQMKIDQKQATLDSLRGTKAPRSEVQMSDDRKIAEMQDMMAKEKALQSLKKERKGLENSTKLNDVAKRGFIDSRIRDYEKSDDDQLEKAISQLKKAESQLNAVDDILEKGKALPVGTIKKRGPNNFIKTPTGWKYHSRANKGGGAAGPTGGTGGGPKPTPTGGMGNRGGTPKGLAMSNKLSAAGFEVEEKDNGWYARKDGTGIGYNSDKDTYYHNSHGGSTTWNHKEGKHSDKPGGWYTLSEREAQHALDNVKSIESREKKEKKEAEARKGKKTPLSDVAKESLAEIDTYVARKLEYLKDTGHASKHKSVVKLKENLKEFKKLAKALGERLGEYSPKFDAEVSVKHGDVSFSIGLDRNIIKEKNKEEWEAFNKKYPHTGVDRWAADKAGELLQNLARGSKWGSSAFGMAGRRVHHTILRSSLKDSYSTTRAEMK